ncbi:MAG: hypothetical protein RJA61_276 [Candidatus Parcubacteria bacterium]|jgi:hypothetical protein
MAQIQNRPRERENEIENAYAIERERFLEEERIRRAQAETEGKIMEAEYYAQKTQSQAGVSRITFLMMMAVAIVCDISLALIALIPYVGWVINGLLSPCVFILFFTWYKIKGIKYTSMRKMAVLPAGLLIEMIPYINILPGWTVSVILNTRGDMVNKKVKQIPIQQNQFRNQQYAPLQPGTASKAELQIQARQAAKQGVSLRPDIMKGYYSPGPVSYLKFPTVEEAAKTLPTAEQKTQKSISAEDGFKQIPSKNLPPKENYHFAERRERELGRREKRRRAA